MNEMIENDLIKTMVEKHYHEQDEKEMELKLELIQCSQKMGKLIRKNLKETRIENNKQLLKITEVMLNGSDIKDKNKIIEYKLKKIAENRGNTKIINEYNIIKLSKLYELYLTKMCQTGDEIKSLIILKQILKTHKLKEMLKVDEKIKKLKKELNDN